jgi:hypothetical protein
MRLVVEHISLLFNTDQISSDVFQARCFIFGNGRDLSGNPQTVRHLIPLTARGNPTTDLKQVFTGGEQLTMHLEAGQISVLCSSGTGGQKLSGLEAYISGELVPSQ